MAEKATLSLGLLALALALPPWPTGLAVFAVASLAAVAGAGVPVRAWIRALLLPAGFVATGAATLLFTVGSDGVGFAAGGPAAAAGLVSRSAACVAALLLLALTTPATDLVAGLVRLRLPEDVAEMALLIYRFLFVLSDTLATMQAAQDARLGHIGWRRRIRSSGLLAAGLLPRALARAHALEVGLAARGWTGGALATLAPPRPISPGGLAAVLATLAAVLVLGLAGR